MIEREKLVVTLKRIGYENDALKKILRKEIIFVVWNDFYCQAYFIFFNILLSLYLHGVNGFYDFGCYDFDIYDSFNALCYH